MGKATGAGGTTINDFELVGVTFGNWLRLVIGLTDGARRVSTGPVFSRQVGPTQR
jgi:hypothetical protein